MKIKIICPNQYGKLEFTVEALEKLLTEAYNEGYSDGCRKPTYGCTITSSIPSISYLNTYTSTIDSITPTILTTAFQDKTSTIPNYAISEDI